MQSSETLSALQKVTMALEEIKGSNWTLPKSDDPDDGPQPATFLEPVSYTHLTLPTNREV